MKRKDKTYSMPEEEASKVSEPEVVYSSIGNQTAFDLPLLTLEQQKEVIACSMEQIKRGDVYSRQKMNALFKKYYE